MNVSRHFAFVSSDQLAGTGVDLCEVSAEGGKEVSVSHTDEGIVVSGDADTVKITDAKGEKTYSLPADGFMVMIGNDGTIIYDGLKDLSLYSAVSTADDHEIIVKDIEGRTLVKDKDYSVRLDRSSKIGKVTAMITGKGDYSGTKQYAYIEGVRRIYGAGRYETSLKIAEALHTVWKTVSFKWKERCSCLPVFLADRLHHLSAVNEYIFGNLSKSRESSIENWEKKNYNSTGR